ncbi:MAG: NAD(P)H-dependent oxidoreductase subunit E [Candidatus Tyrphobacter sp.]
MTPRQEAFPALLERLRPQCDAIVSQYEHKRSALLPIAHLFQQHEGFVSPEAMGAIAAMLELTPAVVESTVSFYTLFYRRPVGKYVVQVCRGLACTINGAEDVMQKFRERLGIGHLETTDDGLFSYEEVECLAACDRATCAQVNLEFVYDIDERRIDEMIAAMRAGTYATAPMAQTDAPQRRWSIAPGIEVARGGKAPGARDTELPDNAGGVGDKSGIIMLDRIVEGGLSFAGATRERAVNEAKEIANVLESATPDVRSTVG